MKKPKEDLFRIIKAMTPAEKRYFKVSFSAKGTILRELFDLLNQQDDYDEEALKAFFAKKGALNFKVYKFQLQQLLLKVLTVFHSKKSAVSKIRMGLEEVDLLMEKQLYDIAREQLDKIKKLCRKYEEFTYLIEVIWRQNYLTHIALDYQGLSREYLLKDIEETLEHLSRHFQLSRLGNELIEYQRKNFAAVSQKERLESPEQLLQTPPIAIAENENPSFKEQLSRNFSKGKIYGALGQVKKEIACRKANVHLFDRYPHFKRSLPLQYLGTLRNYLNYCLEIGNLEEAENLIATGKSFAAQRPLCQDHLIFFYYSELEIAFQKKDFEKLLQLMPSVHQHLEEYNRERDRIAVLIFARAMMAATAATQFKQAVAYLNLIQQAKVKIRRYHEKIIFLLEWVLHFESGEEGLARDLLQRFLRRQEEVRLSKKGFFPSLLSFLQELLKRPLEQKKLALAFYDRLEEYKEDPFFFGFQLFKFSFWLEALSQCGRMVTWYAESKKRRLS